MTADYEVVNRVGRTVATCGDLALAKKWVRKNAHLHDGLVVVEVVIPPPIRRVVWMQPKAQPAAISNVTQLRRVG